MAITTYTELKTAVANWLHRSDVATQAPDFITLAEIKAFRFLRTSWMEEDLNVTISSGVATLPTDYVSLKFAYIDQASAQILTRKTAEQIYAEYPVRTANGTPVAIARQSGDFIFGPYPSSNYTVKGVYYKRLSSLSDSVATNAMLVNAPDIYLYGALLEAAPYLKNDSRIPVWEQKYKEAGMMVQGETDREELSGGPLAAVVR